MANTGVRGRVVYAGTTIGIEGLEIVAVDLDPFFSEDILNVQPAKTDPNGNFDISYSAGSFDDWIPGRNPDIIVRVYAPGGRLIHETSEQSNVSDSLLAMATMEIHRANVEGWLSTNATLNPTNPALRPDGMPLTWTKGNHVELLQDGVTLFPALTDAVNQAQQSIRLMNMNFWLSDNLVTKFTPDPPPDNVPVQGVRIHESLKARSKIVATTNILVQDVPFFGRIFGADTDGLVKDFFKGDNVAVRALPIFLSLLNLPSFMHAKAVVLDGTTAFVLGSTMSQSYFGAHDHLIHDPRHGGSLVHDMSLKVQGPAVEHIDRTFTTLWNAADSDASALSPSTGQTPAAQDDLGLQIVRTLPGGTITASHTGGSALPHGETSALEAYQRAIALAQKYIYLEDQYFTAPEVFDALLRRMKQAPGLELILVLNCNPDVSGYPEKQVQLLEQFRSDLAKALGAAQAEKRLGLFTIWSCNEQVTPYEIMPIYVHSKTAIIDDVWATIGSANLDGASLNHIQLATIVQQKLADAIEDGKWWKRLLLGLTIFALTPLVMAMVLAMKIGITRPSQHANPGQSRQPIRSSELNVVICEQNPQHSVPNKTVKQFREALWGEHLGLGTSLPPIGNGWVDLWQRRAKEKLANLQSDPPKPVGQRSKHPAKILAWTPETDPEQYLQACLGAELRDRKIRLRSKAAKFNFKTGTWERT